MKDKKNIILAAVLVVAAAAIAAVVVLSIRAKGWAAGKNPETTQQTTPEETAPEPTTPEETKPEIQNPDPYVQEGEAHIIDENNQVLYGWYPHSLMEQGITGLEAAEYDENGITTIDGTRYMRVAAGEGYDYYRFEMIKWDIIADEGTRYLLLASQAIDCVPYNDTFDMVSWEKSSLCAWLNGSFYETAFSEEEQNAVVQTELGANRNPIYQSVTGEYLSAKVFLFSAEDLLYPPYGYDVYVQTDDPARVCAQTPFAEARGVHVYTDGNCKWWTRTNGVESSYAIYVNSNGVIGCEGSFVNSGDIGVRPAVRVSKELIHTAAEAAGS